MGLTDHKNLKDWGKWFKKLSLKYKVIVILCAVFCLCIYSYFEGYSRFQNSTQNQGLVSENQNLRDQIAALNIKLSSIQRRFGNSDSFEIKKLLASKADYNSIPASSTFFPEDHFYASTSEKNLSYQKIKALDFEKFIRGEGLDPETENLYENLDLHLWRVGEVKTVQNNSIFSNLVACVNVCRIDIETVKEEINSQYDQNPSTNKEPKAAFETRIHNTFEGDVVGFIFAIQSAGLYVQMASVSDTKGEMVSVQKLENVLHTQSRLTLKDAIIDGKEYKEYYVYLDMTLVSVPPSIYAITSIVPTPDASPRGIEFDYINQWFNQFAILVD